MMNTKALYKLTYGLYLLSVHAWEQDNACIINTAVQVASTPLRLAISVQKSNKTHAMIMESGTFTISALTQEAPFALFERFGMRSGRDENKFDGFADAERASNGVLRLNRYANAYMCCQLVHSVDLGSHTLFIAEVTDMQVLSDAPSCTYAYYQSDIKPKPQAAKKTGWVCTVCGHVYEGETLPDDYICPLCKHGKEDFQPL